MKAEDAIMSLIVALTLEKRDYAPEYSEFDNDRERGRFREGYAAGINTALEYLSVKLRQAGQAGREKKK